jgi:hypothetical protein
VARVGQIYAFFGRTPISTVDDQNLAASLNDVLNSCIQIKLTRISRQVTIPDQVCFCLDAKLLEQIAQNQANQLTLVLSATNLVNLRNYALLNLPWLQRSTLTQSCLTFSTEYLFDNDQVSTILFRSVIDLEGRISQQIKQELTDNPALLNQISQAHYWLIGEILAQLPFKSKAWYYWLLSSLMAIAIIIINILIWYLIPLNYLAKLLICLGIFLFGKSVLSILITQQLKSWIIYHLLDGILSKSVVQRQIGLKVLSFLL